MTDQNQKNDHLTWEEIFDSEREKALAKMKTSTWRDMLEVMNSFMLDVQHRFPTRPVLPAKHTADEAKAYSKALQEYENVVAEKKAQQKKLSAFMSIMIGDIQQKIISELGCPIMPDNLHERAFSYAYEVDHAHGYEQVASTYSDIVNLMAEAYQAGTDKD